MPSNVTEFDDGTVFVKVRSKRGTGTRDQDEVTVEAAFDDLADAEAESERLNDLVEARLAAARDVSVGDTTESAPQETTTHSKVYLGSGAGMRGWIPLPTDVIEDEIVPLVRRFDVEDADDVESVSVNFTKDVSASGWHDVDAGVVTRKIEPLVKRNMVDIEDA